MSRTEHPRENAHHVTLAARELSLPHLHFTHARVGMADIHMHTTASDGAPTPQQLLDHVQRNTNLDVIAITDHDTLDGALRARDLMEAGEYRFQLIVGEEVSTREGHLLGLFLHQRIAPGQSIERSIDQIHEQGGLAIVAHPFHRMFRFSVQRNVMDRLLRQPRLHPDGIEVLNGSFAGIGANRVAMTLSRRVYRWAETGSSDAHTLNAIGCARTRFPGSTAEELRAALADRATQPAGGLWAAREYMAYARHVVRTRAAGSRALGEHAFGSEHAGLSRAAGRARQRA